MKGFIKLLCYSWLCAMLFIRCSTEGAQKSGLESGSATTEEISRLTTVAYEHPYFAKGDSSFNLNDYDQAIIGYKEALKEFRSEKNPQGIVRSLNLLGYNHRILEEYAKSLAYLDSALILGRSQLSEGDLIIDETHYCLGQYYDDNGDTVQAFLHHHLALDGRLKKLGPLHKEVSKSFNAIGNIYRFSKYDYENAERYYRKSLRIKEYIAGFIGASRDLAISYYNLATTSRLKGDYDNVILFSSKALTILRKDSAKNSSEMANCYNAIANSYYQKGEYGQSIQYGLQALGILKTHQPQFSSTRISCLNNTGRSYYQVKKFPEAKKHYLEALQLSTIANRNFSDIAYCYLNLGDVYKDLHVSDSAFFYLKKCLKIRTQNYAIKHPETSFALYSVGIAFAEFSQYDSALYYFQRSLIAGIPDFDSTQTASNPSLRQVGTNFNIPFVLCAKAETLINKFKHDTCELAPVHKALFVFSVAEKSLLEYQRSYNGEDSKLDIAKHTKQIYEGMLECAYILYRRNQITKKSAKYEQVIYDILWKSKARLLRESIERASATNKDTLLDNLVKKELLLERKLNAKLIESRQNASHIQEALKADAYQLNQQLDLVKNKLKNSYPQYYHNFYAETMDLKKVKKYYKEQKALLIEFFWGTRNLYALSMAGDSIAIAVNPVASIDKRIDTCLTNMLTPPPLSGGEQRFDSFTKASFQLSKQLLGAFFAGEKMKNKFKKVVIVPDGALVLLPFEALVLSLPKYHTANYKDLDYLVKQYPVAYRYWSYAPEWKIQDGEKSNKLLAVGYEYSDRNHNMTPLPGIRDEIETIHKIIDGKMLLNEAASEENFKANIEKYSLIHLALHGSASRDGSKTQIEFYNAPHSSEDGVLQLHELYTLHIPARMISLVACETGSGKERSGEGIYSMARAFNYAGCRTLIASLFNVNNRSATDLVKNFYGNVRNGVGIDYALQKAKISYLHNADETLAHPSAWASLIVIGDTTPVFFASELIISPLFTLLPITMAGLFVLWRLSKKTKIKTTT